MRGDHAREAEMRGATRHAGLEYEYQILTIPASSNANDVRRMLTDQAEYGRWELARSRLYVGGRRRVWLRRPIIRVRSTLSP